MSQEDELVSHIECEGRVWEFVGHPDPEKKVAFVRDGGQRAVLKLVDDVWTWHHYGINVSSGRSKIGPERRKFVYERDRWRCRYCWIEVKLHGGPGRVGKATLDHLFPKSRGGSHDEDNLVTACAACNHRKGDRTPEEAGMVVRPVWDDRDTKQDREY